MIKIINGTCGCKSPKGGIAAKSSANAPFSLEDCEEKRLVKLGVAMFIEEETPQEDSFECNPNMSRKELDQVASSFGIDSKKAKNKEELVAMIQQVAGGSFAFGDTQPPMQENSGDAAADLEDVDDEQTVDDGEAPPTFDVDAGIVGGV